MRETGDFETVRAVEQELRSGEKLVWCGRPIPGAYARSTSWSKVLFGIPFLAFALFWVSRALEGSVFFALFGIPFIAVGLGMLGSPIWNYFIGKRTIYAVTDTRLLNIRGGVWPSVKSYQPSDIDEIECRSGIGGVGSVIFRRESRSGGRSGSYTVEVGFVAIPNVRSVMEKIEDLSKHHG